MVKHSTNVRKIPASTISKQQPNRRSRKTVPVVVPRCCMCTLPMPCATHSKVSNNSRYELQKDINSILSPC